MRQIRYLVTLLLMGVIGGASLVTASVTATAQDAAPFADLGLPELNVTVSDTAYEGIPEETEAGRYLVTVTADEETEFGGGVGFVKPEGMSAQEFLQMAAGPPDIAGVEPDATPELGDAEGEDGPGAAPPAEFYQFAFAGGFYAPPGATQQGVLDLTPGEWVAWGDDPEASQEPVIFTVTGEMPADLPEPESSATVRMAEYSIEVSEGELTTGQQVVKVTNIGAQPHFLIVAQVPETVTESDLEAVLQADLTGTPAAVDFNPDEDFNDVAFTGTQSTNTELWLPLDLEAGKFVLVCFFPDIESGLPHAYDGMYSLVEVRA